MMYKKIRVTTVRRNLKFVVVSLLFTFKPLNFDIKSKENYKNIPHSPIGFKNFLTISKSQNLLLQLNEGEQPCITTCFDAAVIAVKITSSIYVIKPSQQENCLHHLLQVIYLALLFCEVLSLEKVINSHLGKRETGEILHILIETLWNNSVDDDFFPLVPDHSKYILKFS